jgi:hypothetical protein
VYCRPQTSHLTVLVVTSRLRTSRPSVQAVKRLLQTSLLIVTAVYYHLRISHPLIEIRRTSRLIVLVAKSMCQRGRLFALPATRLQTNLLLFDLTATLHRKDHLLLVAAMNPLGC